MSDGCFIDAHEVRRSALPPGHVFLVKLIRGGKVFTGFAEQVEERENGVLFHNRCITRVGPEGRVSPEILPDQSFRKGLYGYLAFPLPKPSWWPFKGG